MIKLFRVLFSILIVLSLTLATWTGFALVSKSSYESELYAATKDIYKNELAFVVDIRDLTSLLFKDAIQKVFSEEDTLIESETFTTEEIISEDLQEKEEKVEDMPHLEEPSLEENSQEIIAQNSSEQMPLKIIEEIRTPLENEVDSSISSTNDLLKEN